MHLAVSGVQCGVKCTGRALRNGIRRPGGDRRSHPFHKRSRTMTSGARPRPGTTPHATRCWRRPRRATTCGIAPWNSASSDGDVLLPWIRLHVGARSRQNTVVVPVIETTAAGRSLAPSRVYLLLGSCTVQARRHRQTLSLICHALIYHCPRKECELADVARQPAPAPAPAPARARYRYRYRARVGVGG